jgi:hypothetical protein
MKAETRGRRLAVIRIGSPEVAPGSHVVFQRKGGRTVCGTLPGADRVIVEVMDL